MTYFTVPINNLVNCAMGSTKSSYSSNANWSQ